VRSSYLATATNRTGQKHVVALTDGGFGVYPREVPWFRLPFTRTEYYLAESHTWDERFYQYAPDFQSTEYAQVKQERVYQPGNYQEQWAGSVIGPRFPNDPLGEDFGVRRQGDRLQAGIAMFSDSTPGHFSRTPGTAPGRTALYRDGVLIEESPSCCYLFASSLQGYVSLPPEPATYRLDIDGDYGFSTVSPRVTGSWTFRSGHVDGDEFVALPLMAVRYTPRLDDRQRAPAGERFQVPVTVEGHFGAPPTEVRSLTVEVSVDDGATWRQAPLTRQGAGWVATIRNPNQGYVSLRAKATNDHASTVDQTIIRAYAISST
jgi:hypothetical protein